MKIITLISIVFISFIGYSQSKLVDKTEINTRWINLKSDAHNSILFQTENHSDSLKNMIDFIEKMTKEGASIYFLEKNDIEDKFKYYADIFAFPNRDSILAKYPDDHFVKWKLKNPQNFIVGLKYYCSLKTADSLDVVIIENGGDELVLIAPIIYTFIEKNAISNIRIREELIYNSKTQTFEFSPVGIFLAPQVGNNSNYEIWIDFERLKSNIPNPEKYDWYNFILNKQYSGVQYMQTERKVIR